MLWMPHKGCYTIVRASFLLIFFLLPAPLRIRGGGESVCERDRGCQRQGGHHCTLFDGERWSRSESRILQMGIFFFGYTSASADRIECLLDTNHQHTHLATIMAERSGSDERSVRLVSHDEMSHIAAMNTPTGGSAVGMGGGGGGGGASDDDMLESLHPGILPMSVRDHVGLRCCALLFCLWFCVAVTILRRLTPSFPFPIRLSTSV